MTDATTVPTTLSEIAPIVDALEENPSPYPRHYLQALRDQLARIRDECEVASRCAAREDAQRRAMNAARWSIAMQRKVERAIFAKAGSPNTKTTGALLNREVQELAIQRKHERLTSEDRRGRNAFQWALTLLVTRPDDPASAAVRAFVAAGQFGELIDLYERVAALEPVAKGVG